MDRPWKSKEKYGLLDMKPGEEKAFSYPLWGRLRLACHFTGKKYNRVYRTQKVKVKNRYIIKVYRLK